MEVNEILYITHMYVISKIRNRNELRRKTYLSTISFIMRFARLLSTFLKFFKSFFFRTAVVGVEGLLVLFGFGVPLKDTRT